MPVNTVINGISTNYLTAGQGDPVLLLHGWGANMDLYARLRQNCRAGAALLRG